MTSRPAWLAFVITAALTGCYADVTASSRTYLGPQGSGVVVRPSIDDTSREVTRLFEIRGYALVDQHVDAPNGERRLKFKKANRAFTAEKDDNDVVGGRDVGSVFYAWIGPSGASSTVSLLGKPTLADVEPCTNDGVLLPCAKLSVDKDLAAHFLTGHTEADVVHGVLSELELEGYVVGTLPADASTPTPDPEAAKLASALAACHQRRHDAAVAAGREQDPDRHRELVHQIPSCDDDQ